ncbi:MAG TPA: hypothetical protein GX705_08340 [Clostridiales bacterium]|nr:hypothetical protein [Clostridiales bacterium]
MIDDNGEEWAYVNPAYIYNNNPYDGTFYHLGKNNDAKMAFLQDKNFNVKLIGADKGVMKYTMSVLDSGNEIQRIVFEKIDITDTTVIYTNTDRFNSITLSVDTDNNGIIDYHVNPSYILTEDEIDDLENIDTGESILIFEKSSIITSSVETGLQIYAGSVNINKSISTDGLCEIYANEVNTINCNTKSFSVNGQLAESHKELYYLEATEGIDEFLHNVQDILPEDAVSLVDTDMIYYTTQKISDFVTANSIAIYLDKINSDENCVLYSRNGNINISGSEVNYNGIIYAPNGTVTISANDVRISGTIIAKKVIVYGTNVTFE